MQHTMAYILPIPIFRRASIGRAGSVKWAFQGALQLYSRTAMDKFTFLMYTSEFELRRRFDYRQLEAESLRRTGHLEIGEFS